LPDGGSARFAKGAPQVVRGLCTGTPADTLSGYDAAVDDFATRGDRALGVAEQRDGATWRLLGLLPLANPRGRTRPPR